MKYISDPSKVSEKLTNGMTYFKGDSFGNAAIVGNGTGMASVYKKALDEIAPNYGERTLGSMVGLNPSLMLILPEKPAPIEKRPHLPYID